MSDPLNRQECLFYRTETRYVRHSCLTFKKYNMDEGLQITRRKLPHWTLEGSTYFVTFRTAQGELSIEEQKLVLEHVIKNNEKFYTLIAVVIMPDHVHLMLTPSGECQLRRIMKGIKGTTARLINIKKRTSGSVWMKESFDRIIRDQKELDEKLNYMLYNSVKKNLVDDPYKYHGWYFNEKYGR
ncbi:MAG: hypothetical protein A2W07_00285 [candidate division Zixibacteria bacterium RBG_16_43_9]|nr:MAG: hypothetical protein A2W07_00285 [candidate division Zixibacteria bacterium RBG_16_43_9]